jgi:division protein CdvB (Snf7/Vps24/ESCRT-III family)
MNVIVPVGIPAAVLTVTVKEYVQAAIPEYGVEPFASSTKGRYGNAAEVVGGRTRAVIADFATLAVVVAVDLPKTRSPL